MSDESCVVFVTERNASSFLSKSIRSLINQSFQNFFVLFVDDASSDDSYSIGKDLLDKYFRGRYLAFRNDVHLGKAANAYIYLNRINATFCAIMDGDDSLIDNEILRDFDLEFSFGSDVVWSEFITSDGLRGCSQPLDPSINPRLQGWKTSHFFSFRLELFRNIPQSYFQDDTGMWFESACDQAIAYPILDQTRRYKFINRISYEYNTSNPNSHHNLDTAAYALNSKNQILNASQVLKKPPLPLTRT